MCVKLTGGGGNCRGFITYKTRNVNGIKYPFNSIPMQNLGPIIRSILCIGLLDFVVLDIDHRTLQEKMKNYQMI
jgi:hypothetical protein